MLPISIVICTRGRGTELSGTLASLSKVQVPPNVSTELLLIENGPESGSEASDEVFQHPQISFRHLFEPESGKSQKLNRAIKESSGEILIFSDDDVRFPTNWIERMSAPIQLKRASAVAGGVAIAPHLLRPWMNHTHRAWLASTSDYLDPTSPSEICGANMSVLRSALQNIGGFDLELGPGITNGSEDTLVSWQLKQAGYSIEGALSVRVEHHFNPQRLYYSSWLNAARQKGRARAYLMYHWEHRNIPLPLLRYQYFQMKLTLRRTLTKRPTANEEGVYPWEFSYEMEKSTCFHYALERNRPCRYPQPSSGSANRNQEFNFQ